MSDLNALREFCTVRQLEVLEAYIANGSANKTAKAIGISRRVVDRTIAAIKKKAALRGHSPAHDMTHIVPDGFKVKGVSTYYDHGGKPRGQWVKSAVDDERREQILREAVAVLSEDVKGLSKPVKQPVEAIKDLVTVYPLGDPHIGMYAWSQETGDDFDADTAKRLTLAAVDRLVASTPAAYTAIILPLGDVFHADNQTNQTPGHHHQLDVDTRFVRVLGIGIETFRHVVLRALEKHEKVVVRFVSGNHDPHSIWALAFTISAYFSNDERVTVDLSPSKFWYYRHGKTLIGATHGDTVKHDQLLGVMASDRAKDWGETVHRYWLTGHVHHQSVREYPGVTCESFRTLAARDAYAAGAGYRAGRDMRAIVYHCEHGEIERHRVDVGMLAN